MATFSMEDVSKSLASIFSGQIHAQFNRSSFFDRVLAPETTRTVAEEEALVADEVTAPRQDRPAIAWDLDFGA